MLEKLPVLAGDPILGLALACKADPNPLKVDLGAGIYKDESGATPIMTAVHQAQLRWLEQEQSKVYISPAGLSGFNEGMIDLLPGQDQAAVADGRVICVQATGGCAALRIAAGVLKRCSDRIRVWVSTPTWANHLPLPGSVGLELVQYPCYDPDQHVIDFEAMLAGLEGLRGAGAGDRFDYIQREKGMFSSLGISRDQVQRLRTQKAIYMVTSSRINVAGLNRVNLDYVVQSLMEVL